MYSICFKFQILIIDTFGYQELDLPCHLKTTEKTGHNIRNNDSQDIGHQALEDSDEKQMR